jgi:hypothetical protein
MTTIITRLYPDAATAQSVAAHLSAAGHPARTMDVITAGGDLHARLAAAGVSDVAAAAYAGGIGGGGALVVVRAPFNPIGAARSAIDIVDSTPSVGVGLANENMYRRERAKSELYVSVLTDHPRIFSSTVQEGRDRGLISDALGMRLLSKPKTRTSAMGKARRIMTGALTSKTKTSARSNFSLSRMLGLPTVARSR